MGDLPRWVDRPDVDSAAMYSAFMAYDYHMKTQKVEGMDLGAYHPIWYGHLHMYIHKVEGEEDILSATLRPRNDNVREMACRTVGCRRCEEGRGGYQFKWYSRYWAKWYHMSARPGAWKAPEPLEEPTAFSIHFWERVDTD